MNRLRAGAFLLLLVFTACTDRIVIDPDGAAPWFDGAGETVGPEVVSIRMGSEACGLEEVAFLEVQWPLGDAGAGATEEMRQYVGDPEEVLDPSLLQAPYDARSTLPEGASYTGLHTEQFQLWVGPDADQYIYLVAGPQVEAWPRADPPIECR